MNKSCYITPKVFNKNTNKHEPSLLHLLIQVLTENGRDYRVASSIYWRIKNDSFINKYKGVLVFNSLGEPDLNSVLKVVDFSSKIPNDTMCLLVLKLVQKTYPESKGKIYFSQESYVNMLNIATQHNLNSQYKNAVTLIVNITTDGSEKMLELVAIPTTPESRLLALLMSKEAQLHGKLVDILKNEGVGIEEVDDLFDRVGANGEIDFNVSERTAEGLINLIHISKNESGIRALPEEFSHFAIATLRDHPLVKRLLNSLRNEVLLQGIMGDLYENYYNKYNGNLDILAEEAAGKILRDSLLQQAGIIDTGAPTKLLLRVIQTVKSKFSQFSVSEIEKAVLDAQEAASILSRGILQDDYIAKFGKSVKDLTHKLYQLSLNVNAQNTLLEKEKKIVEEIITTEVKRLRTTKQVSSNTQMQRRFYAQLVSLVEQLNDLFSKETNIDNLKAIQLFISNAVQSLQNLMQNNPMTGNIKKDAKTLRHLRNYIYSYKPLIGMIMSRLKEDEYKGLGIYLDTTRAQMQTLKQILDDAEYLYSSYVKPLVLEFFKSYISEDIIIPFGKDKGKVLSVEEAFEKADKDITFCDRWLDSMADSSSLLLNMYDKVVKHVKESARLDTLDIVRKIKAAGAKLEASGVKDFLWMFDKNTMNYISESKARTLGEAKYEFYQTIMTIKAELDSYLPEGETELLNSVKIRKGLFERLQSNPQSAGKQVWENIKDTFIRRSDNEDFGGIRSADFEGNPLQFLPIYYIRMGKNEKKEDLSTDVVSTMCAYAAMAIDYKHMDDVVDILEVSRDYTKDNLQVGQIDSKGNVMLEIIESEDYKIKRDFSKPASQSNIMARLDTFFDMLVYSRYLADEGTIGSTNIDKAKFLDFLGRLTSVNMLGLNVLAGGSNVVTGHTMMKIEAFGGLFFNAKDTLWADRTYAANIIPCMAELGKRIQTNKLTLWMEEVNVLLDFETDVRDVDWNKKSRLVRGMNSGSLYVINSAGEHWMQTRTSLALAHRYKMKDNHGKECNLWDALEVVPVDPKYPNGGKKLKIKDGYTKLDGSQFTRDDLIAFSRRCAAINQKMHGIYNKLDKSAIQQLGIGRLAILFRKWMRPAFNKRFKSGHYNFDLDAYEEGYYRTTGRFIKNLMRSLKEESLTWSMCWSELDVAEKANIKKALTEVAHFLAVSLAIFALGVMWKDEDKTWVQRMLEYLLRRLQMELGAQTPSPFMLNELLKLVDSPIAATTTANHLIGILGLLNPWNYEWFAGEDAIMKSGRYKDLSKAERLFWESYLIPLHKQIYRVIHPEESTQWLKQ